MSPSSKMHPSREDIHGHSWILCSSSGAEVCSQQLASIRICTEHCLARSHTCKHCLTLYTQFDTIATAVLQTSPINSDWSCALLADSRDPIDGVSQKSNLLNTGYSEVNKYKVRGDLIYDITDFSARETDCSVADGAIRYVMTCGLQADRIYSLHFKCNC